MANRAAPLSSSLAHEPKPLAVPVKRACELIGVGNTTMWGLIATGRVKTTSIGRKRLVIYSSLEELVSESTNSKTSGPSIDR